MKLFFGPGTDQPIRSAIDVRSYLPDDKKYQYCDGFSMAEAAKSWVSSNGSLPFEIANVVGSNELNRAHFEYPTFVWGGGKAMTDVMAFLPRGVIAVEAKVDEPFDDIVFVWIEREAKRNPRSPTHRSTVIQKYAKALRVRPESLMNIRYQLLQRTLCAAITARNANLSDAWMIVHSFPSTRDGATNTNRTDFDNFVALVSDKALVEDVRVRLAWASHAPR
jgi:hypothetical protein